MSIASAPADQPVYHESESAVNATTLSVFDWHSKNDASRCKHKSTEKGRTFFKEVKLKNRELASKSLKGAIHLIKDLYRQPEGDLERLEAERHNLDNLKDKLNAAQQEYDDLLVRETEKEEPYRWFDLKDREYNEC